MITNYLRTIICKKCHQVLENVHYNTKYCKKCYDTKELIRKNKYRKLHIIEPKIVNKKCSHCHAIFTKSGRNQKYCIKCIPIVIKIRDYNEAKNKNPFHYCQLCKKIKIHFPNQHKYCPRCQSKVRKLQRKKEYLKHKNRIKKSINNWRKKYPYYSVLIDVRQRCYNPRSKVYQYYGGRGIINKLTNEDIKFLWFKDNADKMKNPHLHRKNVNGNYTKKNCQFIEKLDHEIIHLKLQLKRKIKERQKTKCEH